MFIAVCVRIYLYHQNRTDAVKYFVGDVVLVEDVGRGVVTGWTVARSHAFADLHVTYEVLPHSKHNRYVVVKRAVCRCTYAANFNSVELT